jgi:ribonuclease Z
MYLNERADPLEIFGPEGTTYIIKNLLNLGYFNPTFEIVTNDLKDKDELSFDGYDLKVRGVDHGVPALAFCIEEHPRKGKFNKEKALKLGIPEGPLFRKLQEGSEISLDGNKITPKMVVGEPRKGRKIVYSGDTKPTQALIELAQGCDVLIHDATLDKSLEKKASDFGHSSSAQAANIAKEAQANVLFLTHISPRYKDAMILENEAKNIFQNSYLAVDFLEHDVPFQ